MIIRLGRRESGSCDYVQTEILCFKYTNWWCKIPKLWQTFSVFTINSEKYKNLQFHWNHEYVFLKEVICKVLKKVTFFPCLCNNTLSFLANMSSSITIRFSVHYHTLTTDVGGWVLIRLLCLLVTGWQKKSIFFLSGTTYITQTMFNT